LELGLAIAEPDYRTVCFVERDGFAAATLVARMEDEAVDQAPIWADISSFDGRPWRGKVDIVSAGYPCQPFSFAGHRRGAEDRRHLWPHVARIVREAGPRWVFCENVDGHIDLGFSDVGKELQEMGFDIKAGLFTAAETGAAHLRRRLFVLAYADHQPILQSARPMYRRKGVSLQTGRGPGRIASGNRAGFNPNFSDWLMGWPIGWSDPELPVTEFRLWLRRMRIELSKLPTIADDGALPEEET
jgi:DNA (cytosine-5)-methyltransferase 1